MIIDAHQHFWQLDLPFDYGWLQSPEHKAIFRDYLPEDLAPHLAAAGIEKSVFVQTQHNVQETRWGLELARHHDFIAGVVGWIDLTADNCEEQLLEFRDHPRFVGIRHITQDEPDDDFIIRPEVVRGLRVLEQHGVPFDLLFYTKHLKHAATLGRELPGLPMVIDHISKPPIKSGSMDGWVEDMRTAAAFPNMYCKLSGMVTEADWEHWKPAHLKPYVEVALDAFGPERCMFGSDWPVCELAASYQEVHAALMPLLESLSESERAHILGGTASGFYRLADC